MYKRQQIKPFTSYIYLHVLGEPLSHPKLEEILSLCQVYGFNVQITTNGTLLKKTLPVLMNYKVRPVSYTHLVFKYVVNVL